MKSYGQRCIRMPPLRGGQSSVHLCLSAAIKKRRCAAHHPSRYWSFDRTGTRRALVGGKPRASRSLRHRSIVGRRRTEGFALATRAARCSLRSHSPLLPWRRVYRYKSALVGHQKSVPDRPGLASLDSRPIAGPFILSVQVVEYRSVADVAPGRTRSLRSLRSFKSLPSIQRIVSVAPPTVGDDIFDRPGGCDDAKSARRAIAPLPRCRCCRCTHGGGALPRRENDPTTFSTVLAGSVTAGSGS